MKLLLYPHPILRAKLPPVPEITDETCATVRQMFEVMYQNKGTGLAANQVGVAQQIVVMNKSGDAHLSYYEIPLINPQVVKVEGTACQDEGCLSLPGLFRLVRRPVKVKVQALNIKGQLLVYTFIDLEARIIQHEIDHLNGILFIDHLNQQAKKGVQEYLTARERDNDPPASKDCQVP